MRHYNDIDHIVPIIDRWNETYSVPISVVVLTDRSYLHDFRLEYLRSKDRITVTYIDDIIGNDVSSKTTSQKRAFDTIASIWQPFQSHLVNGIKIIGRQLPTTAPRRVWDRLTDSPPRSLPDGEKILAALTDTVDDAVIAFDWPTTPEKSVGAFTQDVLTAARNEGYTTVSLPHGDKPYTNHLRSNSQFDEFVDSDSIRDGTKAIERYQSNGVENFDYVVHPNERSAERHRQCVETRQLRVLGSPRFNEEWIPRLAELVPEPSLPSDGDCNLVLFVRNTNYPIFWSEVVRAIRLISKFEEFELIVKYHTRGGRLIWMLKEEHGFDVTAYPNVHMIAEKAHSVSLIEWADVTLDLGTSIAFEPIVRQMPVLSLEFAHANESTISHYVDGSRLHHRDALYDALLSIRAGEEIYDVTDQNQFRSEMLGDHKDVLGNYVAFLAQQFTGTPLRSDTDS